MKDTVNRLHYIQDMLALHSGLTLDELASLCKRSRITVQRDLILLRKAGLEIPRMRKAKRWLEEVRGGLV